ncbi:hypothetical protein KQH49_00710 [Mycetohabitans sp. B5]|uniref:Uncharacterized protein n=1 Tax=Mycetohabitans endofungorum TaxID=417203 RepID=A0A2P5K8D5_9BURK|nr:MULTISPECIES: hypothetical protein [Mycetohabitans]MCG1053559.1 hypothetical protein [Mycetohabitans sp. B5]PPB82988.1 hypothetical protein B0O95_11148 [Mycetohabitans endofungorum]
MKKQHCPQFKILSIMLGVIMMLVGCGGNTPSTSSQNDKDFISPTSGSGLSDSLKESRTPDFLAAETVKRTATNFSDMQAASAALTTSRTEQHITSNDENVRLPFVSEGASPIPTPFTPRSPNAGSVSFEPIPSRLQKIKSMLHYRQVKCFDSIEDKNFALLVFRLMNRFRLNDDSMLAVIRALNLLHHHNFERYVVLLDVYGDPDEERHRRYDHVSSLFDIIAHSAMATESWRYPPDPFIYQINQFLLSDALGVLGQAMLLQKSVEQGRGAQNLVDFSEIREKFESYVSEHENIYIDLKKVELKLSGNSASLSAPLAPAYSISPNCRCWIHWKWAHALDETCKKGVERR